MTNIGWTRRLAVVVMATIGLAGCGAPTQTHVEGSRAKLYGSVEEIAADSALVVVAKVTSQTWEKQDNPYTLSTIEIATCYGPQGLGTNLPVGTETARASAVVVRQMGDAQTETPAPLLEPGKTYLLFLTPTMLSGDAGTQFFVTGGSAGIFSANGETFVHGPFTEGDTLPETLTSKDLAPTPAPDKVVAKGCP